MTPEQIKARELVLKFDFQISHLTFNDAKKCALICVNEIINSSPSLPIKGDGGYFYEDIELSIEHFKKIKTELEKL